MEHVSKMLHTKLLFGLVFSAAIYTAQLSFLEETEQEYFTKRSLLLGEFNRSFIGADLTLSQKEALVNGKLMNLKLAEIDQAFNKSTVFLPSQHFFRIKSLVEKSSVFKLIKKLPKGASLHSHDVLLVSNDYLLSNITYRDNLYVQLTNRSRIAVRFFGKNPGNPWVPISEYRKSHEDLDQKLKLQMTMFRDDPEKLYEEPKTIWDLFVNAFIFLRSLITYKPVFEDHFYQALKELHEDNVKYLEFRALLPQLYDLEGKVYGPEDVIRIYYETAQKFKKDHPDFLGVKLIYAPLRTISNEAVEKHIPFVVDMQRKFPDFIAGYDLNGEEDAGPPLSSVIPALLKMREVTNLFFHAGETSWNGQYSDQNLLDAVLLNATRIGQGFAIMKHPEVLKLVQQRGIPLEISPISNQGFGFVKDQRNHPANNLVANKHPIVLGPDVPSALGTKALSYDWYMMFMGISQKGADLRLLKQFALNSIKYSNMNKGMKQQALNAWKKDWEVFLDNVIADNY